MSKPGRWGWPLVLWALGTLVWALGTLGCTVTEIELSSQEHTELVKRGIKISPPKREKPTPTMLVDFAHVYLGAGQYDKAANFYQRALMLDSRSVPASVGLAKIHLLRKSPEKALEILQEARRRCPKSPEIYNELAIALAMTGDYADAIGAMQNAVDLAGGEEAYRVNLASILAVAGEYAESFALYSEIFEPAEAHYRIAGILYRLGRRQACLQRLRQTLDADPEHPLAAAMFEKLIGNTIKPVGYLGRTPRDGLESPGTQLHRAPRGGSPGDNWSR